MTDDQTAPRLVTIAALMLAAAVLLKFTASTRWFDLYGTATIALAGALPLLSTLMRGLERRGRTRWLAVLAIAPVVTAALVQIGYWTAFFLSPKAGIPLGLGRLMLNINAGYAGPAVATVVLVLLAWVAWLAVGPPARRKMG